MKLVLNKSRAKSNLSAVKYEQIYNNVLKSNAQELIVLIVYLYAYTLVYKRLTLYNNR